jgi:hypothetical protein
LVAFRPRTNVPVTDGVPVIRPVVVLSDSPVGSEPDVML